MSDEDEFGCEEYAFFSGGGGGFLSLGTYVVGSLCCTNPTLMWAVAVMGVIGCVTPPAVGAAVCCYDNVSNSYSPRFHSPPKAKSMDLDTNIEMDVKASLCVNENQSDRIETEASLRHKL